MVYFDRKKSAEPDFVARISRLAVQLLELPLKLLLKLKWNLSMGVDAILHNLFSLLVLGGSPLGCIVRLADFVCSALHWRLYSVDSTV